VLMDKMLSLPEGLKDGDSVVEFTSEQDLRNKIVYYLEHADERIRIAGRGRHVAMSRHRSWHRMEEIIFGERLTQCQPTNKPRNIKANMPCPFTVHATF